MWDNGIPQLIEVALSQLESRFPGTPYVVFISGEACRTIWPGLANKHLERLPGPDGLIDGKQPLPGSAGRRPAAVVRVTPSNSGEVPRPAPHIVRSSGSTIRTTKALLQLDELGGDRVFLLANVPRQYDGDGRHRRVGAQHSRWTAAQDEQPLNWYQHTAPEILVCGVTEGSRKYGVAAARLCDHAISWDGRTQYPAPLHLAMQMDRDHPEYRRTVFIDEQSAALSEEELGDEATLTT
jgi:RNaseH domain of pPIWI_RE